MAIVQSAEVNANGVTSQTLAFGSNVTAGNAVVAACAAFNSTLNAFTDNNGGSYSMAAQAGDGTPGIRIGAATGHPAGATTVTADPSGTGDIYFVIVEDDVGEWLESGNSATGTSTTPAVTTGTLPDAAAVAYAMCTHAGFNQTITEGGSATLVQEHEGGSADMPGSVTFQAAGGSTSAISFTWTTGSSQEWLAAYAVLGSVLLYPVDGGGNGSQGTSLSAAADISPPTGTASGNLLVAWLTCDNTSGTDITASTGWTQLFHSENGTTVTHACFARIADGGANDTLNPNGAAQDYCAEVRRYTNHGVSNVASDIVVGAAAQGASGNADPPSITPPSSKDWLFVASCGVDFTTGNTISADPANYSLVNNRTSASSTSSCGQRIASRNLTTGSAENPGTFTNTSRTWVANTIAIPPPTSGPPPQSKPSPRRPLALTYR